MQNKIVLSAKAAEILALVNQSDTKLGDLRKCAKDIKKDHNLALELWLSKLFLPECYRF